MCNPQVALDKFLAASSINRIYKRVGVGIYVLNLGLVSQ